ncbi:MAG: hypothetical protein ACI8ZM_002059 [Crocinitomix sp.]|jgi:hypothetical protein
MRNPGNSKKLVIILFFLSNLSYAQFANDIGISLSQSLRNGIFMGADHNPPQTGEKLIIDYRHALNDKLYLVGGVSFGMSKGHYHRMYEWNDVYQLNRNHGYQNKDFNLRIGIDRNIKESIFSIGGNIVLGYRSRKSYAYHDYLYYDEVRDGWIVYGWKDPQEREVDFNDELSSDLLRVSSQKIRIGAQTRLSAKVPLGNRIYLNGYVGAYGGMLINTSTDIHSDPLNEASGPLGHPYGLSTLEFQVQYGVGLSYRLGGNSK